MNFLLVAGNLQKPREQAFAYTEPPETVLVDSLPDLAKEVKGWKGFVEAGNLVMVQGWVEGLVEAVMFGMIQVRIELLVFLEDLHLGKGCCPGQCPGVDPSYPRSFEAVNLVMVQQSIEMQEQLDLLQIHFFAQVVALT